MTVGVLPGAFLAATLAAAPPERAPRFDPDALEGVGEPRSGLHLEPRRDGSYLYRDSDAHFRALVHEDGSVEYLPPPADLHLSFLGFDLLGGRTRAPARPGAPQAAPPPPIPGTRDPTHDPNSYGAVPILVGFGVGMPGMADMVQRGRDFAAKARFLDDTADLRRALAEQVRERHTRDRLGMLGAELETIWNDEHDNAAQRRALLFARWDECAEAAPEPVLASERETSDAKAGERARRQIEAFIRRRLPSGEPDGFSAAELERFNAARRSRQRFDPYRAPADASRQSREGIDAIRSGESTPRTRQ